MSLTGDLQSIVDQASQVVWRVERGFVRKRLAQQLPRPDGKRYNEIVKSGVESVALDLAGLFWAIAGWCVGMLVILPEEAFISSRATALRYGTWAIVVVLFGLAFIRMLLARRSSGKYQRSHP
jgi:hypothetical protein